MGKRINMALSGRLAVVGGLLCALQACGLPEGGTFELRAVDNLPGCKVWGSWPRYTWTGSCVNGLTAGAGTLDGYSGSTKMMTYTGVMKDGVRHGRGRMWVNNDAIYGGPTVKDGLFEAGSFREGTESSDDMVYTVKNGSKVSSQAVEQAPQTNWTLEVLGAAAQVAGAGSSPHAQAYQAYANAIQASSRATSATTAGGPPAATGAASQAAGDAGAMNANAAPAGTYCTDAELMAKFNPEIEQLKAQSAGMGICQSGRAMKGLAERMLGATANCPPSAPGITAIRSSFEDLRRQAVEQIQGACGN